jgi:hypothetical protein
MVSLQNLKQLLSLPMVDLRMLHADGLLVALKPDHSSRFLP